jgi:hypothetical protein
VLDDKWNAIVRSRVVDVVNSLTLALLGRVQQLAERYSYPLPEIDSELEIFDQRVVAHLARIGVR